jgi:Tol biopolymer transport system component
VLSPDHRKVVFTSARPDGALNIFVINVDGTGLTRLTTGFVSNYASAWSSDGRKIAFRHALSLHVVNADGTGELDLGPYSGPRVSWSPDSRLIATEDGPDVLDRDIWAMRADGTGQTNLTASPAPELQPAWSPEGTRLAFTWRTVVDRDAGLYYDDVWVMNASGTGQKQLTRTQFTVAAPTVGANHPSWSPDGSRILFQSDAPGKSNDLYTVRPDGSGLTNLTNTVTEGESSPGWSSDGSKIVFRKSVGSARADVFIMNADGSGVINLSKHPQLDQP